MSHTLVLDSKLNAFPLRLVKVTIVDYAVGGETITPSEIDNSATIDGVILGSVPPTQNSLGVPLFPILSGGKVMLFRFVSGVPTEITATTALNAVVTALVHVS